MNMILLSFNDKALTIIIIGLDEMIVTLSKSLCKIYYDSFLEYLECNMNAKFPVYIEIMKCDT